MTIEAGASVTGSCGPATAAASFGLSSTTSKATAEKQNSRFSQEITAKASNKVRTATRDEQRTRALTEVIESAQHGFGNTESDEHIAVI